MSTMRIARLALPLLLFVQLSCLAAQSQAPAKPVSLNIDTGRNFRFVIFGDLRMAPTSDTMTTDPVRRKAILDAITKEKPAFVAISGDIVLRGDNPKDWAQWDLETAAWSQAKIAVFPALGNHDLNGNQDKALTNYFERFPQLGRSRFYAARAGNVLVLTLDSSLPELDGPQGEWMKSQFDTLPADVDFVLVSLHHPPITRSHPGIHGGHSARPEEIALARWLEEKQKSLRARIIVAAGHVHNYERYERNGVVYVVSGGGGASPYALPRDPADAYRESGPAYHYCTLDVRGNQLTLEMHKLDYVNGSATWRVADRAEVTTAPQKSNARASGGK